MFFLAYKLSMFSPKVSMLTLVKRKQSYYSYLMPFEIEW